MNRTKRLHTSETSSQLKKSKLSTKREHVKHVKSSNENCENLLTLDESILATLNLEQFESTQTVRRKKDSSTENIKRKRESAVLIARTKKFNLLNFALKRRVNGYCSSSDEKYIIENSDTENECINMAKSLISNTPNSGKKHTKKLPKIPQNYIKQIMINESGIGVLQNESSNKSKINDFDEGDEYFKSAELTQLYNSFKSEDNTNNQNKDAKLSDDCFTQFYENTQVLNQIETAIHSGGKEAENPTTNQNNRHSNSVILKTAITKMKNNENHWDESLACGISQLFNSTEYRMELNNVFQNLEMSICNVAPGQDKYLEKNTSACNSSVKLDWTNSTMMENVDVNNISHNESMGSFIKKNLLNNATKMNDTQFKIHVTQNNYDETRFECLGPFYGLPLKVKDLINQYKGIDQLYEWQDECLNLKSIKERKNLVYALPTSGGKTLVSEILILREILCRKRNAIFVLPYVSIVQEKVWALSPFAVALDFLVEEYAAGKGTYPPRKRRFKNSVFVATIEKALGLVNSLIELGRLKELGLVVVDELHLIGEPSRGCTLEILLTKLMHANEETHIVGMSATIGNLKEICSFLNADVYTRDFRPVELKEYVKHGPNIYKINKNVQDTENFLQHARTITTNYANDELNKLDPDKLGALVLEVVPSGSCLVFCASKKNCENVAQLICKAMTKEILKHKHAEKLALINMLKTEGNLCPILSKTLPYGTAYHHSGLTSDERRLIEEGFRAGTISTICCTSTLAAGVNLPAKRVILRSPYIGRDFLNLARYKQMVGRAGRTGLGEIGESILICDERDQQKVLELLQSPMDEAVSNLHQNDSKGLQNLVLSCIGLGIATTRHDLYKVSKSTLLARQEDRLQLNVKTCTDQTITILFKLGAILLASDSVKPPENNVMVLLETTQMENGFSKKPTPSKKQILVKNSSRLVISQLGRAAIKGGLDLSKAHMLYEDLVEAQASLVLLNCLHLLYLVTPYDLADQIKPNMSKYYSIYIELGFKELQTARILGITEGCAVKMASGQPIKNVKPRVLNRFYLTLILHDLWNEKSVFDVSEKYQVNRGIVQQLMTASATFAFCIVNFCEQLEEFWAFADLLKGMSQRLQHCSSKELLPLMDLPAVKQGRARQLYRAGFKTLQSIAKADPNDLINTLDHMSRRVAHQLIAAAKILENDELPQQICIQCLQQVNRSFAFKQKCEKSDGELKKFISLNTVAKNAEKNALYSQIVRECTEQENYVSLQNIEIVELVDMKSENQGVLQTLATITEKCLSDNWDDKANFVVETDSQENYMCDICNKVFSAKWKLSSHLRGHTGQGIYICEICGKQCSTSSILTKHIQVHAADRNHKIQERKNMKNKPYKCPNCDKGFLDLQTMKKHNKEQHFGEKRTYEKKFSCHVCGKKFCNNNWLEIHMRKHTGERPLTCEKCGKTFAMPSSLHKHVLIHQEKKHKCDECGKAFTQAFVLKVHKRTHSGERPFVCGVCGKATTTNVALRIHMRTHSGEKPYACNQCDKTFASRSQYTVHQRRHSGQKPYVCVNCGRAFLQKGDLDTHMRYHSGHKPYACSVCPKKYHAHSALRIHMMSHTGVRPHECMICHKRFVSSHILKTHVRTHTGDKPYSCQICGHRFTQSGGLSTHMKSHKQSL